MLKTNLNAIKQMCLKELMLYSINTAFNVTSITFENQVIKVLYLSAYLTLGNFSVYVMSESFISSLDFQPQ